MRESRGSISWITYTRTRESMRHTPCACAYPLTAHPSDTRGPCASSHVTHAAQHARIQTIHRAPDCFTRALCHIARDTRAQHARYKSSSSCTRVTFTRALCHQFARSHRAQHARGYRLCPAEMVGMWVTCVTPCTYPRK